MIFNFYIKRNLSKSIFERKIGKYKNTRFKSAINQSDWVLTGTGWSTNHEVAAIEYALSESKHVVSMIDHWVNYEERFFYDGKKYLPDEIWVTDGIALKQAKSLFKNLKIRLINNNYVEDLLSEISQYEKCYSTDKSMNILYICEPMRTDWGREDEQGEFQAMRFFFKNLHKMELSAKSNIVLRLHPSEDEKKYDKFLIDNFSNFRVEKVKNIPLSKQIAQSDIVVGCQSYALAIAAQAKKTVISTLPPWAPECVIPLKNIKHLKKFI